MSTPSSQPPGGPAPLSPEIRQHLSRMREYWLVLLTAGPERGQSEVEANAIQRGHLEHLFALRGSGALAIAGPVLEADPRLRGICIFTCEDRAEVEAHLRRDPAVRSGRLSYEILRWGGIAGDRLPEAQDG